MKFPTEADVEMQPTNSRFAAELERLRNEWADAKLADKQLPLERPKAPRRRDYRTNRDYIEDSEKYRYIFLALQRMMLEKGIPVDPPRKTMGRFF